MTLASIHTILSQTFLEETCVSLAFILGTVTLGAVLK